MARVYVEVEIDRGSDVDAILKAVTVRHGVEALRKTVLLVWFDAEETPTPMQLDQLGADFWDVR